MKVKRSRPFGMSSKENFVCMGIISDSGKDYACLLDMGKAKETAEQTKEVSSVAIASQCCYIEEIHWKSRADNLDTATLHQVDNDEEWATLAAFVMHQTDIFSPKKIRNILDHGIYFYSHDYLSEEKTKKDVIHRAKEGLL